MMIPTNTVVRYVNFFKMYTKKFKVFSPNMKKADFLSEENLLFLI